MGELAAKGEGYEREQMGGGLLPFMRRLWTGAGNTHAAKVSRHRGTDSDDAVSGYFRIHKSWEGVTM